MKRIATALLFAALAMPAYGHTIHEFPRGSRCHDEVCWNMERTIWREATATADGHMANRIEIMLARWTDLGFPDGFIEKHYHIIHSEFIAEMRRAGHRWFFETQGFDNAETVAKSDALVDIAERNIIHAEVSVWLFQAEQ
jgi:hypothetical protein